MIFNITPDHGSCDTIYLRLQYRTFYIGTGWKDWVFSATRYDISDDSSRIPEYYTVLDEVLVRVMNEIAGAHKTEYRIVRVATYSCDMEILEERDPPNAFYALGVKATVDGMEAIAVGAANLVDREGITLARRWNVVGKGGRKINHRAYIWCMNYEEVRAWLESQGFTVVEEETAVDVSYREMSDALRRLVNGAVESYHQFLIDSSEPDYLIFEKDQLTY